MYWVQRGEPPLQSISSHCDLFCGGLPWGGVDVQMEGMCDRLCHTGANGDMGSVMNYKQDVGG